MSAIRFARPTTPSRNVWSTVIRRGHDAGHHPPQSGHDRTGARWKGTSRIIDPAGRRERNRKSWTVAMVKGRDDAMVAARARRALAAIDAETLLADPS